MILVKEKNFSFRRNIICLISSIFICSCGGGGGGENNLPVSQLPNEQASSKDPVNNLLPFADIIKAIETDEYFNQWGLSFINASSAYLLDATGKGSIVAVVDEALDWSHHEFLRANILQNKDVFDRLKILKPTIEEMKKATMKVILNIGPVNE